MIFNFRFKLSFKNTFYFTRILNNNPKVMMSLARFVNIEYRFTDVFDDKSTKEPHKPKDSDQNYLGRYFCLLFDFLL